MKYPLATAPKRTSKHWRQSTITWPELLQWAVSPAGHKECGNYLLGTLRDGLRRKDTVVSRSAITLDVDHARADFIDAYEMLLGYRALIHSTYQSTSANPRFRVIIPLTEELTPDEYVYAAERIMDQLGAEQFDPGSREPERFMFKPSAADPTEYLQRHIDAPVATRDDVLAGYDPQEQPDAPPRSRFKRDPHELAGAAGAFNRAYTLDEAIAAFSIPYERVTDNRYHLVGASSEAGISIIDDQFTYSHHANDPAFGETCSAFDLVRLHRYASLDDEVSEDTPVNRRPSHDAMLEFASQDAKVLKEMVGDDFDFDSDALEDEMSWMLKLTRNPRTGKMNDVVANWDLIRENDAVFRLIRYNDLTDAITVRGDLPWRPLSRGGEDWSGTDYDQLLWYIERAYGAKIPLRTAEQLVATTAQDSLYNPVADYLASVEGTWDGTPRVETCLPGVEPSEYTRLVARRCIVAAVARALDPGCRWDHSLILYGTEGIGKTSWVRAMARGWESSLGNIGHKDTLMAAHRSWIVTADEGFSMRKQDADAMKEFLTRTTDLIRRPYEKATLLVPRRFVIWGTTNDPTFLRKQEGNRRFLIVNCAKPMDFDAVTPEWVDQVWAEALVLYRAGEPLYMDVEQSTLTAAHREDYTEEDPLSGLIEGFLEGLVPDEWDTMTTQSRLNWLTARDEGFEKGTQSIVETCSAQIWCEVLGQEFGRAKRTELLEISNILKDLPGWESAPGRKRLWPYGPQKVFRRTDGGVL